MVSLSPPCHGFWSRHRTCPVHENHLTRRSEAMNIALWVTQALLALAFGAVGFTKLRDDRLNYARARPPMTSFPEDLSDRTYKTIGVLEVLGAIGLVLPRLLGIAPVLTPLAALGFVGLMIGAI